VHCKNLLRVTISAVASVRLWAHFAAGVSTPSVTSKEIKDDRTLKRVADESLGIGKQHTRTWWRLNDNVRGTALGRGEESMTLISGCDGVL
jgi:hypothetical protein